MQFNPATFQVLTMAIYPPFKAAARTVIMSAAIISTAILTTSCSYRDMGVAEVGAAVPKGGASQSTGQSTGQNGSQSSSQNAADAAGQPEKGVSTSYDIYHSKALEVPAGTPVPAITIRVDLDDVRGWNLYVGTANFTFTPEDVGGESSPSGGHAQLYINDKPMQRIYGTWTHLPELPPGTNKIRVTLNANGYETLTTQNMPIEDAVTVKVYDPKAAKN